MPQLWEHLRDLVFGHHHAGDFDFLTSWVGFKEFLSL